MFQAHMMNSIAEEFVVWCSFGQDDAKERTNVGRVGRRASAAIGSGRDSKSNFLD